MPFEQEMSQLVGEAEAGAARTLAGVDEDPATAADAVGQEAAFEPVEGVDADLLDPEVAGDFLNRNRRRGQTPLGMDGGSQPRRVMDVGKLDAVNRQRMLPPCRASASSAPFPR